MTLVWETAAEIDTAGFNILRSESQDGPFEKINDVLIPGEGGPTQGAVYSYVDDGLQSGTHLLVSAPGCGHYRRELHSRCYRIGNPLPGGVQWVLRGAGL